MNNSRGLLYPALHKFYSALSSLEKFEKGTKLFDNIVIRIISLRYRNTPLCYKNLWQIPNSCLLMKSCVINTYLMMSGKWFVNKRNEVLKQQPFNLEKRIVISIYSDQDTFSLPELIFTIDNDVDISTIIESLRTTFIRLRSIRSDVFGRIFIF